MKNILIIRQSRILLEQSIEHEKLLSLKICVGTNIHKFNHLAWSQLCHRWETTEEIKIGYLKGTPIQLQLYHPSKSIPKVLGQATIDMAIFSMHLEEELKIALTYNGMIKGWLYCQISIQGEGPIKISTKYLCINKISFHLLEDSDQEFNLTVFQNTGPIYSKKFIVNQTSRTLFPNIKNSIKYSDVVRIILINEEQEFRTISFLVDHIKRGKTAIYQTWLRNKFNNKAGEVKVQYFLQNLFLENDRKVMSRKAVFPKALTRASSKISQQLNSLELFQQETKNSQKLKEVEEYSQNQSTTLSSQDLNSTESKSFKIRRKKLKASTAGEAEDKKNENAMPCMKRKNNTSYKKIVNKEDFHFQHPFE